MVCSTAWNRDGDLIATAGIRSDCVFMKLPPSCSWEMPCTVQLWNSLELKVVVN